MLQPDCSTRATWGCIHFESTSNVEDLVETLATTVRMYEVDASQITDTASMVNAVAPAMAFPKYVRSSSDGLLEFLRTAAFDSSEDDTRITGKVPGILLIVRSASSLFARDLESAGMLINLWLSAAENMSAEGVAVHLVFEIDQPMLCGQWAIPTT